MKIIKLEIRKHDQYNDDYKDEIVGTVQIVGETGKMEVRLHPSTVAQIFRSCKADVQRVADYNASPKLPEWKNCEKDTVAASVKLTGSEPNRPFMLGLRSGFEYVVRQLSGE